MSQRLNRIRGNELGNLMDLNFTVAEKSFRDEIRTWLEENKPKEFFENPKYDRTRIFLDQIIF